MHCSSQTQNWDKCTARYSAVGGFVRIHRVPSEKSDSVGVIHGLYLGALKLWSPLGSSEFCRILSLTCSWAHSPLCFLDLSFTPLSEHVLRCNFSWMCPTPPVECVSPHLVPSLLRNDNCSTIAQYGQTGWGVITANSRWAQEKAGYSFLILK